MAGGAFAAAAYSRRLNEFIAAETAGNFGKSPPRTYHGAVYLAGPITHKTYDEARYGWREFVAAGLMPGIRVLSPMRHEGHLAETLGDITDETGREHIMSKPRTIFTKDKLDIQRADVVLANFLEAEKCPRGTLIEVGMANMADKFVVSVIKEGSEWDYGFITEASSIVVRDLASAVEIINSLLSDGV